MICLKTSLLLAVLCLIGAKSASAAKMCSKPRWEKEIAGSAVLTADFPLSGAPSRRLARICRSRCLADSSCMAYEYEANGKDFGDCSLFGNPGPIIHTGNKRMAAGICRITQDNPNDDPNDNPNDNDQVQKPVEKMGWNIEEGVRKPVEEMGWNIEENVRKPVEEMGWNIEEN